MNINDDQIKVLREIKEICEKADDCSGCPYEVYDVDLDEHICFFRLAPTFWGDVEDNKNELKTSTTLWTEAHWIEYPHECGENWEYPIYECSNCHESSDYDSEYCPGCGAYMKGK